MNSTAEKSEADARAATAKELASLAARNRDLLIDVEALKVGGELGFVHPAVGVKLLDRSRVEVGDNGRVSGVRVQLERIVRDMPEVAAIRMGGGSPGAIKAKGPGRGAPPDGGLGGELPTLAQYIFDGGYEPM